ncbi:hypothetical protein UJ101_01138 [Flavobacteriaceae bacterium UJ101]|nr:hypothetical protein UJ101_01138 [Flavobacteriaceae bacterium UJ101]
MRSVVLYIALFVSSWLTSQIEPTIHSDEQKVAEPFTITYEVSNNSSWTLPTLKKRDIIQKNLEIVNVKLDTLSEKIQLNLQLIAFDSGIYTIPSYRFKKGSQEIRSFEKDIHVSRVKVNTLQKPIYDIKPIKEISLTFNDYFNKYRWILIGILIALIIAILSFLIYWFIKSKPFAKKEEPEIPPGEEALSALSNLKEQQIWKEDAKVHYSKLTDVLRHYFERKLHFDAPESTSDEILSEIQPQLEEIEYKKLRNLLYEADLVKFAKSSPEESKHLLYLDDSVQLVQSLEEKIVEETEEEEEEALAPIEIKKTYFEFLGNLQKEIPKGDFALWWKIDSEDHFTNSISQKVWDSFYQNELAFYPYILGVILYEKGLNNERKAVLFPESEQQFVLENETVGTFVISISKEKGFTILMNTQTTSNEQRNAFLIEFITNTREFITNEITPPKQKEYKSKSYGDQAKDWYLFIRGMVIKSEKKGKEINRIAGKKLE